MKKLKKITATRLRSELYRVLDAVLETGEPIEVTRATGTVVIKPVQSEKRARSKRKGPRGNPDLIVGDPDDLVHIDWSQYWKPRL